MTERRHHLQFFLNIKLVYDALPLIMIFISYKWKNIIYVKHLNKRYHFTLLKLNVAKALTNNTFKLTIRWNIVDCIYTGCSFALHTTIHDIQFNVKLIRVMHY